MSKDEKLVARIKQGDESAFTELVNKYQGRVYGLCFSFTHNRGEAKDLSQEAFIKVHERIGSFREEASFYTWFYQVILNLCRDYVRRMRREQRVFQPRREVKEEEKLNEKATSPQSWTYNPERITLSKELSSEITRALGSLSEKQRDVFILRNFHDLSIDQIAKILRCASGTVKVHLFRAAEKLQKELKDYVER